MYDLVISGGRIVDGTGAPPRNGDIAIKDGVIAAIGQIEGTARETIEADGALVTPGFIDVHTHYDGQFLWDDKLDPSFSNGVTTAIAGNCGVGFAPARPEHRRELVQLMEGVEDIPESVLNEGLAWNWTSFPDYLDRLAERRYTMDVAVHITHAPLRVFVMGDRALNHEQATAEDIAEMSRLVRQAMVAGAVGFSGARITEHTSSTGANVPGTFAADVELLALARAMGETGKGTFQIVPMGMMGDAMQQGTDRAGRIAEHGRIAALARAAGRPLTYIFLDFPSDPGDWRMLIEETERANAAGLSIHPQTSARALGQLSMLDGYHRFMLRPSYIEIAHLPLAERVKAMREPARRAAILAEVDSEEAKRRDPVIAAYVGVIASITPQLFPLTLPLDYEPGEEKRLSSLARAAGKTDEEYLYDHFTAGDGRNITAAFQLNYEQGNLDNVREMMANPTVISGLGDAGAHMKLICDSSLASFQLAFWTRDRSRGPKLPIEAVVRKMTHDCAALYGLSDRGTIEVGKRADLNVIDYDRLAIAMPKMVYDLPAGAGRLLQPTSGYLATIVAGEITRRNDAETGARPGRLVRSR
jgi:N-acyl-D-aspartate/D-glutamate deacylase